MALGQTTQLKPKTATCCSSGPGLVGDAGPSPPVPRVRAVPAATTTPSEEQPKPTLMLLDGNSLAFRAFYALPAENFKTRGGLTTNAVYGVTAMLINLLREQAPTHIAAAFA